VHISSWSHLLPLFGFGFEQSQPTNQTHARHWSKHFELNYCVGKSDFALLKETIQLAKAMTKAIEFQLSELDLYHYQLLWHASEPTKQ